MEIRKLRLQNTHDDKIVYGFNGCEWHPSVISPSKGDLGGCKQRRKETVIMNQIVHRNSLTIRAFMRTRLYPYTLFRRGFHLPSDIYS